MDTQNGRIAEQTELLAAEPCPAGAGRTELRTGFHAGLRTDLGFAEPAAGVGNGLGSGPAAGLDAGLDAGLEAGLDAGLGAAAGPDGVEDPAWDYEDVILRSVN
ncbi:hypothetical protein AB0O31_10675 [Kitasatospora cineracea]|uniref:hypothetical protein n=1 Tax=Kitasatospora cineracea TaxID=88074 RepID=UPI00341DB073